MLFYSFQFCPYTFYVYTGIPGSFDKKEYLFSDCSHRHHVGTTNDRICFVENGRADKNKRVLQAVFFIRGPRAIQDTNNFLFESNFRELIIFLKCNSCMIRPFKGMGYHVMLSIWNAGKKEKGTETTILFIMWTKYWYTEQYIQKLKTIKHILYSRLFCHHLKDYHEIRYRAHLTKLTLQWFERSNPNFILQLRS